MNLLRFLVRSLIAGVAPCVLVIVFLSYSLLLREIVCSEGISIASGIVRKTKIL